jgi:transposase-like protein
MKEEDKQLKQEIVNKINEHRNKIRELQREVETLERQLKQVDVKCKHENYYLVEKYKKHGTGKMVSEFQCKDCPHYWIV